MKLGKELRLVDQAQKLTSTPGEDDQVLAVFLNLKITNLIAIIIFSGLSVLAYKDVELPFCLLESGFKHCRNRF